jgi:signal transduction histidine kinase
MKLRSYTLLTGLGSVSVLIIGIVVSLHSYNITQDALADAAYYQGDLRQEEILLSEEESKLMRSLSRVFVISLGFMLIVIGAQLFITYRYVLVPIQMVAAKEQTEQALAQAEYYSKAKSDFLSRMSHEMRTPMNIIIGMTGIAKTTDDSFQRMNCLEQIDESSRHLLGLINNLLDMSELNTGNFELVPGKCSFKKTIDRITADISAKAGTKKQAFTVSIDPDIPDALIADEGRLMEVLLHLLSNGVKFTPEGGSIHFSARKIGIDKNTWIISFEVKDTGLGISGEVKARLGNIFEQMDNSIARVYGGIGLGLALSKRIVQMMDGSIEAESEPGKGARFICTVKLGLDSPPAKHGHAASVSLAGRRILVVDDVTVNRHLVFLNLEKTGAILEGAADGKEALEKILQNNYDLILMDLHMPGMDGYETVRRVRASGRPGADSVPIIALTADTGADVISRCLNAGMNGHLG